MVKIVKIAVNKQALSSESLHIIIVVVFLFRFSYQPETSFLSPKNSEREKELQNKMERKLRYGNGSSIAQLLMSFLLLTSFIGRIASLSVTVNDVECVYEYVLYEGDTVSGNFVVVDHDIFWNSDHPGIDFTVSSSPFPFCSFLWSFFYFFFDLWYFSLGLDWKIEFWGFLGLCYNFVIWSGFCVGF